MFYPPTCVGLRYGRDGACPRVFLGTSGSLASLCPRASSGPRPRGDRICPVSGRAPSRDVRNPAEPPQSVAPSVVTVPSRCRNVCLLRSTSPLSRPRLSPRLTLGGLALPRKPRVYGGRVTLSSLATHASILAPRRSTVVPSASPLADAPTDDLNPPAASV